MEKSKQLYLKLNYHDRVSSSKRMMMEKYILFKSEIEGRYKEIQIHPIDYSSHEFLIHWDGFEVGKIKKVDQMWHSDVEELKPVLAEVGRFIDEHSISPD